MENFARIFSCTICGLYPMLFDAFVAWKSNPGDVQAIMNLIAQLTMAGGLFHVFIKNLKKMAKGQPTI